MIEHCRYHQPFSNPLGITRRDPATRAPHADNRRHYHAWMPVLLALLVVTAAVLGRAPATAGRTATDAVVRRVGEAIGMAQRPPVRVFVPLAVTSAEEAGPAGKLGIDPLHPIDILQGTPSPIAASPQAVAATGADWVRLNFVLGPWGGVDDATLHHGQTWHATYGAIVDGYRRQGLHVYGLISYEAVPVDPGDTLRAAPPPDATGSAWIDDYVTTLVRILHLHSQDLQVIETVNEPDDWHGGSGPWIHPGWFAILQERVYHAVKSDPALAHITVVSGPLQGFANNHNAAANYLLRVYWEGHTRFDWGTDGVPYPFDGVGYHLYLNDRYYLDPEAQRATVAARYRNYVDQMLAVMRQAEGQTRPLYLSEIGFTSRSDDEQTQADNLQTVLALASDDPAVALAVWFAIQDFPQAGKVRTYGLYRSGELLPNNRKPAFSAYQAVAAGSSVPAAHAP